MITLSRKEGSFVNAISYIRNVGKSFGYATIDVLKQHNSTSIAFAKKQKSLVQIYIVPLKTSKKINLI